MSKIPGWLWIPLWPLRWRQISSTQPLSIFTSGFELLNFRSKRIESSKNCGEVCWSRIFCRALFVGIASVCCRVATRGIFGSLRFVLHPKSKICFVTFKMVFRSALLTASKRMAMVATTQVRVAVLTIWLSLYTGIFKARSIVASMGHGPIFRRVCRWRRYKWEFRSIASR